MNIQNCLCMECLYLIYISDAPPFAGSPILSTGGKVLSFIQCYRFKQTAWNTLTNQVSFLPHGHGWVVLIHFNVILLQKTIEKLTILSEIISDNQFSFFKQCELMWWKCQQSWVQYFRLLPITQRYVWKWIIEMYAHRYWMPRLHSGVLKPTPCWMHNWHVLYK